MNNYLKKTLHYFAGNLFNKILLIVFLPIFTHFMIPAEYAVYTNFLIFIAFARLIYLLGMQESLFPYFHAETSNEYKFSLISSIYLLILFTGLILSILILFNNTLLSQLIVRNPSYDYLIPYIVIIIFCECIYGLTLSILNMMESSANYAILGGVKNLILLILFLFGTFTNQFTLQTIFQFIMISSVIAAFLASFNIIKILKKYADGSFQPKWFSIIILIPVVKFGLVMIPGTIAMLILRVMDRYMLTYLSAGGLHDVGIYATGYRVGMVMQVLVTMVSLVFFPYAMRIAKSPEAKGIYRKIYNYYILFGCALGSLIILFSNEIFTILIDNKYHDSFKIVFIGAISVFLLGVFNILNIGFYIKRSAKSISLAVSMGALLNLVMNYVLIPEYGIIGAGISSIAAYLFIVIYNFIQVERKISIGYNEKYLFLSIVLLLVLSYLNFHIPSGLEYSIIKIFVLTIILLITILRLKRRGKIEEFKTMYKKGIVR